MVSRIPDLIILSLASYAVTFVIASSEIFEPVRAWIQRQTPRFGALMIPYGTPTKKHPIACRMCVGFWVSLAVCNIDYVMVLPVYGLSYFLCTQEK